jgi:LysR family glycine cleavage system transcriptional activator
MTTPSLNTLRAFDAAARHGTLSAAARELQVTTGAISQQINQLEAALEAKLFERHRRGLRLTEAGSRLHTPIELAMELIQEGIENLKSVSTRISIALSPSLAAKWLIPSLSEIAETNPEIDLQIITAQAPDQSDAEFILHLGAAPSTAGRKVDLLCETPLVAVTGPTLIARAPVIARESFFAQYLLIEDASRPWAKWLSESGTTFQSHQVAQSALALDAAEAGTGIALVPAIMAKDALAAGRLVKLKEFPPEPGRGLYLIRPANTPASKARRIVEDWIRSAV